MGRCNAQGDAERANEDLTGFPLKLMIKFFFSTKIHFFSTSI